MKRRLILFRLAERLPALWPIYRAYVRWGERRARRLCAKFGVLFPISGTNIPNAPCLRVVEITILNSYGQRHTMTFPENAGRPG